jgi:hemin uptake protein HemP
MSECFDDLAQAFSSYSFIVGKVIPSANLLGKNKSVVIVHDDQRYVLRVTKLGKLILTK